MVEDASQAAAQSPHEKEQEEFEKAMKLLLHDIPRQLYRLAWAIGRVVPLAPDLPSSISEKDPFVKEGSFTGLCGSSSVG